MRAEPYGSAVARPWSSAAPAIRPSNLDDHDGRANDEPIALAGNTPLEMASGGVDAATRFNLLPTDMGVVVRSNPCGLEDDPTLRIRGNHPDRQFVSNPGPLVIRVNCQIAHVGRVRAVSDATQHAHESVPIPRRQDNIEPSNMRRMRPRSSIGQYNGAAQYRGDDAFRP